MRVRPIYAVALCVVYFARASLAAAVFSERGPHAEEEHLNGVSEVQSNNVTTPSTVDTHTREPKAKDISSEEDKSKDSSQSKSKESDSDESKKDSSDKNKKNESKSDSSESKEDSSEEDKKNKSKSDSSESKEDSSEEKRPHSKVIKKRSLDLTQDPLNQLGESSTKTSEKEISKLKKYNAHLIESTSLDTDPAELTTQSVDEPEVTAELRKQISALMDQLALRRISTETTTLETDFNQTTGVVANTDSETPTDETLEETIEQTESETDEKITTPETQPENKEINLGATQTTEAATNFSVFQNHESSQSTTTDTANPKSEGMDKDISSSENDQSKEQSKNKESDSDESKQDSSEKNIKHKRKSDSEESKDNSSEENEKYKSKSDSSESEEDSSEEKRVLKKIIKKRSLDSNQDSLNQLGESSTQASDKEISSLEKDEALLVETTTLEVDPTELTTLNVDDPELTKEVGKHVSALIDQLEAKGVSTTPETDSSQITGVVATATEPTAEDTEPEADADVKSTTHETQPENEETDPATAQTTEAVNTSSAENHEPSQSTITDTAPPKSEEDREETFSDLVMARVNKLSDQIRHILSHYRQEGVVVVPGQSFFPDPMPMQDFHQSFSIGTIYFKTMNVFGLSNFTVEHINTDVDKMQVYILLHMKRLVILGNYTLKTFFSRSSGPFNVTLLEVDSEGVAEIETAPEGHLEATDSQMDMFTQDMVVDFKNLGLGSMFQGMVGTVGDALFNSIKPQILDRVNVVIRTDVNKKLKEFSTKFINKVAPVDLAFSEGRKYVRNNGYDPLHIKDHTFVLGGLVYINITQFEVEGLSKFYRVGNLSLSMDSGVIEIGVHVMTHKLTGHCTWSGQTFGIVKSGRTNFTVDHLQVRALVNQSLDIRKKPQLHDLDIELGWVKVKMDSPMSLNLMIEGIINAFPRLIRHMIVDTVEQPLKDKVQEILNKINIESIVDDNLPRLDNFGL